MKPIENTVLRKGYVHTVFAKDQVQYFQLPAQKNREGVVFTEWRFSLLEKIKVMFGCPLHVKLLTFNKPLQPIRLSIGNERIISDTNTH